MVERELITKITIPKYLRKVKISNSQRVKYWEWNGTTIKCGSRKLLQKFIMKYCKEAIIRNNGNVLPQYLKLGYKIIGFKGSKVYCELSSNYIDVNVQPLTKNQLKKKTKYLLCTFEDTKKGRIYEPVIANPTKVGNPNYHIIKGQDFYVGLNPHIRNTIVSALKDSYWKKFKTIPFNLLDNLVKKLNDSYPLIIEVEIKDTITNFGKNIRWDVGNRADPYMKTFLDFLVNGYLEESEDGTVEIGMKGLIIDDDRLHVSSGNNAIFTPIDNEDNRELIFYIYQY